MKYFELDKETLEIVSGPWVSDELPVFADDLPLVAKEVLSMPDDWVVSGQVWNDATSSVEDTQVSLNNKARTYLAQTDWYVIRSTETGVSVPADVSAKRAESRASIIE